MAKGKKIQAGPGHIIGKGNGPAPGSGQNMKGSARGGGAGNGKSAMNGSSMNGRGKGVGAC